MRNPNYVFPGVWPFIEQAMTMNGRDLHQAGRLRSLWHVGQVQNALGQLPNLNTADQLQILEHACTQREGLALGLEGIDAAILDVVTECELPVPSFLFTSESPPYAIESDIPEPKSKKHNS